MHEMAYCTELASIVLEEAERVDAVSVNEVNIVIGEMRDIVEELFDGFFHHLVRGTVAEDARLSFARVPVTAACEDCGQRFPIRVHDRSSTLAPACPACHGGRYEVKTGMEFYISSLDVTTKEELQVKSA